MRTDKNTSVWEKDTERKSFPSLEGNTSADVLIIGGGIAGILCAYKLKKAGVNCILVEAKEILSGITKNTKHHRQNNDSSRSDIRQADKAL